MWAMYRTRLDPKMWLAWEMGMEIFGQRGPTVANTLDSKESETEKSTPNTSLQGHFHPYHSREIATRRGQPCAHTTTGK